MKRQATDWRYLQIIYRIKDLCTEHKKNSYDSIIMWCTTQFQNEQPHETSGITGQGVWQIFSPKSNDKIWQNYQNNHFRTLEMDQWHATNWETFTQENLLNLGKNSGIWHFSLEYLPLHPPQPRTLPPRPARKHTHTTSHVLRHCSSPKVGQAVRIYSLPAGGGWRDLEQNVGNTQAQGHWKQYRSW